MWRRGEGSIDARRNTPGRIFFLRHAERSSSLRHSSFTVESPGRRQDGMKHRYAA